MQCRAAAGEALVYPLAAAAAAAAAASVAVVRWYEKMDGHVSQPNQGGMWRCTLQAIDSFWQGPHFSRCVPYPSQLAVFSSLPHSYYFFSIPLIQSG